MSSYWNWKHQLFFQRHLTKINVPWFYPFLLLCTIWEKHAPYTFCNNIFLPFEMKNHCPTHLFLITLNITGPHMNKYNSSSFNIILQFKSRSTEVCLSKAYSNHFTFSHPSSLDQFWYKPPISMLIFQMPTFQPPKFCAHFSFPPTWTSYTHLYAVNLP